MSSGSHVDESSKKKRKAVFAEGTKEQSLHKTLGGKRDKKQRQRTEPVDEDSSVASTADASVVSSQNDAILDEAGLLEDDAHIRSVYQIRDVASWLRLPYDSQPKPKRHTMARAHDTDKHGGELWLLRVPADLDLALLNNATFDAVDLEGETRLALHHTAASSRAVVRDDDTDAGPSAADEFVLSARPSQVASSFKCAFPAAYMTKATDASDAVEPAVHYSLKFGSDFDRAFTLHRRSAALSHATSLNPVYDEQFLNTRQRVPTVPRESLQHLFQPIGVSNGIVSAPAAGANGSATRRSEKHSSSHKESARDEKKSKKKHKSKDKEKSLHK